MMARRGMSSGVSFVMMFARLLLAAIRSDVKTACTGESSQDSSSASTAGS